MTDILFGLIENLLLIIALSFALSFVLPLLKARVPWQQEIVVGLIFGGFAIVSMARPSEIISGVIIDLRGPIILLAWVMMGWRAGTITALAVIFFRIYLGGNGLPLTYPATLSLWSIGAALYWRYRGRIPHERVPILGAGVLAALQTYFWAFLYLPYENALHFFLDSAFVLASIYPLALYLLFALMERERQRDNLVNQLKESEARFKAIFDQTFHFLGLLKPDGTLLEANDSSLKFIGKERAEILNLPFWELEAWQASPESAQQIRTAVERCAKGEFTRFNVEASDYRQEKIIVDFTLTPVRDAQGKISLLIPEGRDISPQILAEQRRLELSFAEEHLRLLKAFIQDASHNLRTPITILQSSLYLMRRGFDKLSSENPSPLLNNFLNHPPKMQRALDDLSSTVEGMLTLLTLEDKIVLRLQSCEIVAFSRENIEVQRQISADKSQSFQVTLPDEAIDMLIDGGLWRQVIQNLLENAIIYTPKGGKISISLARVGDNLLFEVCDTGIGIAEADLPRLFERFFRAENAKAKHNVGTGLGLAIVKRILDLHGGTISIESVLQQGTCVKVLLPIKNP